MRDMQEDAMGRLWIATEHDGVYIIDLKKKDYKHILSDATTPNALPDNTTERIFIDENNAVWIGTYKNGVSYYSPTLSLYPTIAIGDICTMTQSLDGNYWLGTNDKGIICYNPTTGSSICYSKKRPIWVPMSS